MKVESVEQLYQFNVVQDMLKKAVGDGPEFEIIYEALTKQIQENTPVVEKTDENGEQAVYNPVTTKVGGSLEDLPLIIKGQGVTSNKMSPIDIIVNSRSNNSKSSNVSGSNSTGYTGKVNKLSEYEDSEKMSRIYAAVEKYSEEYDVDPNLILAIMKTESNFDPNVKSSAGAMGLMQLMDFNCEEYGVKDPFNIEENIRGGVAHIKDYIDMFDGNLEMGLMAYNGGQGTMERRGVKSPSDLYKMPTETQNYVPKVLKAYNDYKSR